MGERARRRREREARAKARKIVQRCTSCGKDKPHRPRGDGKKLRGKCDACLASYGRIWRKELNWIRRKLYDTWRGILKRCLDRRSFSWVRYGGARPPVTVTSRWIPTLALGGSAKAFANFCQDVGEPPSPAHQLDRKRHQIGYRPSNVRWATLQEQCRNRRTSNLITAPDPRPDAGPHAENLTLCVSEWARLVGLSESTLRQRLERGWEFSRALHTPTQPEGVPF